MWSGESLYCPPEEYGHSMLFKMGKAISLPDHGFLTTNPSWVWFDAVCYLSRSEHAVSECAVAAAVER